MFHWEHPKGQNRFNQSEFMIVANWMLRLLMYSFHRSRLNYDHHIWGNFRAAQGNLHWPYMWPQVAFMVVANIKPVWYLPTTSTTNSQNLLSACGGRLSPQVAGSRRRSPAVAANWILDPSAINLIKPRLSQGWPQVTTDPSAINLIKPRLSHDWLQVTADHTPGDPRLTKF